MSQCQAACACGEVIAAEGPGRVLEAAVLAHNGSPAHRNWRAVGDPRCPVQFGFWGRCDSYVGHPGDCYVRVDRTVAETFAENS